MSSLINFHQLRQLGLSGTAYQRLLMCTNPTLPSLLASREIFKSSIFHILGSFGKLSVCQDSNARQRCKWEIAEASHQALKVCVCVCVCVWWGFMEKNLSSFGFQFLVFTRDTDTVFLPSNITFIFLLKLHINSTLWKAVEISLNMQNSFHRPLYGCHVMYFWDMQIWHFCSVIVLRSQRYLPFSLFLSVRGETSPVQLLKTLQQIAASVWYN